MNLSVSFHQFQKHFTDLHTYYYLNFQKYFVDLDTKGKLDIPISKVVLLPQMLSLLTKAMKLCKETVLLSTYPGLIQSLDGFVTEVIDTSKHLKGLEV